MSKASDFIDELVSCPLPAWAYSKEYSLPGKFIEKFKPEQRELIKELKSSDWDNIRLDSFFTCRPNKG